MFRKDKKKAPHNYDTLISSKTEITGDINFTGGLHVDGKVKGSVNAAADSNAVVRVSDHGIVEGEVCAPHVIINGQVIGDVYSTEHVELARNACVTGTVHYNLIEMVVGAQVNGNLVHQIKENQALAEHNSSMNSDAKDKRSTDMQGAAKS